MSYAALIVAGGTAIAGGIKAYSSSQKEKAAKRELANQKHPFYRIQDEYYQNRNQAAELAGQGLPSAQRDYLTMGAEESFGAALGAAAKGGGGVNAASLLLDNYNNAIKSIGSADAEAHLRNIMYFQGVNKDLAGQKTTQWSVNEYQPYEAKLRELRQNIVADQQNKAEGWNTIENAAISAAGAISYDHYFNKSLEKAKNVSISLPSLQPVTQPQQKSVSRVNYIDPNSGTGDIKDPDDLSNINLYPVRV